MSVTFKPIIWRPASLPGSPVTPEPPRGIVALLVRIHPLWLVVGGIAAAALAGAAIPAFGLLVVAAVLGALIVGLTFVQPEIGLFLFALMLYSRASENFTVAFGVPSIAPLFAVWLLTALVAREGIGALLRTRLAVWQPLIAWGIVMLSTVLVAVNQPAVISGVIAYAKDLVFVLVIVLYARRIGDARILVRALVMAGAIPALLTIYQTLTGSTYQFFGFAQYSAQIVVPGEIIEVARPAGQVGDPNFYALALIPLVPLALHRARWEVHRPQRQLAWAAALVISIASLFTYSRGGFLTLAVVLLALAATGFVRWRVLLYVCLAGVILLPVLPVSYTSRVTSLAEIGTSLLAPDDGSATQDSSLSGRVSEVVSGVQMFVDHPLMGVGVHNYPEYYQEYARPLGIQRRVARTPHSLYVEIAAETGLIGIAVFSALMASLFVGLRRVWIDVHQTPELRDLARLLAISLIAYLVGSIFLHSAYPRFLWMLVGVALVANGVAHERLTRRSRISLPRLRPTRPAITARDRKRTLVWLGAAGIIAVMLLSVVITDAMLSRHGVDILPRTSASSPDFIAANTVQVPAIPPALRPPVASPTPNATSTVAVAPAGSDLARLRDAVEPARAQLGCQFDAGTQHNLCGDFLLFWESNGGPAVFGSPLTEELVFAGTRVQYFENARFEAAGAEVVLTPLGASALERQRGVPLEPPALPEDQPDCVYEDRTAHNICGAFAVHWIAAGGVAIFGFPITEARTEDGMHVQYFERARFELREGAAGAPTAVALTPLGRLELADLLPASVDSPSP